MKTVAQKTRKISTTLKIFLICFVIYFVANASK